MTVGENVQEAVDLMERGLNELAFPKACAALGETIKKGDWQNRLVGRRLSAVY